MRQVNGSITIISNRQGLHEITSRHFEIVRWDEIPSSDATLERLTPEIVERVRGAVPDITERELTTNAVFAVARPRG